MKMRLTLILVSIFCVVLNAQTYTIVEGNFTWHEAKVDAEARGGRLAVLNTQEKIDAANGYLLSLGTWNNAYIGLTDEEVEGSWKWVTGELLTVDNWNSGEPNNSSNEDYGQIIGSYHSSRASWNDSRITSTYSYILEAIPAPEPLAPVLDLETLYESNSGESITIDATPTDGYPSSYTYQWSFKAVGYNSYFVIPSSFGGTAANYQISGDSGNNGTWKVEVSNDAGSITKEFNYRVYADSDSDGLSDGQEEFVLGTDPFLADTDGDGLDDKLDSYPNDPVGIQQDSYIIGEGLHQITPPRLDNIETTYDAYGQEFIAENEILYGFKFYLSASLLTDKNFNLNLYSINDTVNPITNVSFGANDGDWLTVYLSRPINIELGEKYLFLVSTDQPANDKWEMALSSNLNESTYDGTNCTTRSIVNGVLNEQRADGRDLFFDIIYDKDSDLDGINDNDELNIHNTNAFTKDSDNDGLDDFAEIYRFKVISNEMLYSWHECRDDAVLKGGHLATFANLSEWLVAREALIENDAFVSAKVNTVWLGGTDEIEEGNWQWVTGEPFDYQLWNDNEPNNSGGGIHENVNYLSIRHNGSQRENVFRAWTDHPPQGPQSNTNTRNLPHAYLLEDSTDPNNSDTDGDGLSDGDEVNIYSTSPIIIDTDSDGLNDGDEVNVYSTNPSILDTDGDGLNDGDEISLTTDPNDNDSDDDSLLDGSETNTGTWVSASDTGTDPLSNDSDSDGLNDGVETNTAEYMDASDTGTDPNDSDTDNDGVPDGTETNTNVYVSSSDTGTHPLNTDSDADGYSDYVETNTGTWTSGDDTGTDPNLTDTDNDGIIDGRETNTGTFVSLTDTGTDPNNTDSDGDGFTDIYEINTSYDPTNSEDTPDAVLVVKTAIELEFHGASGGTYRIEHSTDLGSWTTVEDNIQGESALVERLHSIDDYNQRFFRVIRTDQ